LEGVSEQIEQAKISEDDCASENDNTKAVIAGTCASVMLRLGIYWILALVCLTICGKSALT